MDDNLMVGLVIVAATVVWFLRSTGYISFANQSPKAASNPVVIASTLLSAKGSLTSIHRGEFHGFQYNLIAGSRGTVVVFIQLHHNTKLHIVGIGAKSSIESQLQKPLLRSKLTKLDLEGDFPKYFSMYCSPGAEHELLTIFDPADMARFADFCQAYDFELYNDAIYMTEAHRAHDKNDSTPMIADVETFLKKNQRLLSKIEAANKS